jgi:hypothetical protein
MEHEIVQLSWLYTVGHYYDIETHWGFPSSHSRIICDQHSIVE